VAGVLAEIGDAGGAGLVDAQGVVEQQPYDRRGAQRLGPVSESMLNPGG
jgi:hypothetical protein